MAGKYFTKEDIRKMMTEKVKDYLDQGWYFNFNYMRVSNGYEFAAVTDGKDTIVIYFDDRDFYQRARVLKVEKFVDNNNEHENIWLDEGHGEILEETQFLYKYKTDTYVIVKGYDAKERCKKNYDRCFARDYWDKKDISEPMKEVLANFIKKQGIPGLKRFKLSDIKFGHYHPDQNRYSLKIKNFSVHVDRDGWDVTAI